MQVCQSQITPDISKGTNLKGIKMKRWTMEEHKIWWMKLHSQLAKNVSYFGSYLQTMYLTNCHNYLWIAH